MVLGSISPRVVALSLGVAAAAGLVAGGAGLMTISTPADGSAPAPSSTATKAHDKTKRDTLSETPSPDTAGSADASTHGKADKAKKSDKTDKAADKPVKKTKKHSLPGVTTSPEAPSSPTPTPSSSEPANPGEPSSPDPSPSPSAEA